MSQVEISGVQNKAKASSASASGELRRKHDRCRKKKPVLQFAQDFSQIPVHSRSPVGVRPKLTVNTPGDAYEREADRVSEQVVATVVSSAPPRIQRFSGESNGLIGALPVSVDRVLASPGRPLDPRLQQDMEERFDYDFSRVHVHSGAAAEQSARDLNAHAYTVGHDIVFGAGRFAPGTRQGRQLIAHELTHVVQQSGSEGTRSVQSKGMLALSPSIHNVHPVLQRDGPKTVTVSLHPEETGVFSGSFKLPSGGGLFYYSIELNNVPAIMLNMKRAELDIEVQAGIRTVLQERLTSKSLPVGLPTLRLRLDAGNTKVLNEGHVERLVRRAARIEMKRLVAPYQLETKIDTPADVLEAIVHIMAGNQVSGDYGPGGENLMHPQYYIEVKKNITKKEYVDLLWEWFRITNGTVTDKHGIQFIVQGSMARVRIPRAVADTEPIIAKVGAKEGARWMARYRAKVAEFTQRAVREEVSEMIEAGVNKELEPKPNTGAMSEDEKIKGVAVNAAVALQQLAGLFRRALASEGADRLNLKMNERMAETVYRPLLREYLSKTFKDNLFVEAPGPRPVERVSNMSLPDAISWLKGGLDAASAILTLTDPVARKRLFDARASYFGTVAQGLEINQVLWKFVSGGVAFYGAGTYAVARALGKAELAAQVLEASTKWIGNVAGALFLVGMFHGIAVLLDPDASSKEKAAAAVEATSSALGVASFASRWTPRLAVFGKWGGPIGISLTLNFWQFSKLADLKAKAQIGLTRLDWVSCFKATQGAAQGTQEWVRKLAVTNVLIAQETDPARLKELRFAAEVYRKELMDQHIKPYLAARLGVDKAKGDPDDCGPALADRFKPLAPALDRNIENDDAALSAAVMFLNISFTALKEWDAIVASSIK